LTPNPLLAGDGLVLPSYPRPAAGVNPWDIALRGPEATVVERQEERR
jgi:hypothetical protein